MTDHGQLDSGTMALWCSPRAGPQDGRRAPLAMSPGERLGEAIRRAAVRLPGESRTALLALVTPQALATMAVVLAAWAASHAVGAGEAVDLLLLVAGLIFVGRDAVEGMQEFGSFAMAVLDARQDSDLDSAGYHLARAVTLLGVAAVSALLLRGAVKAARAPRYEPTITGDPGLPAGEGWTNKYGDITYSTQGSATDQALVLYHEKVHAALSPKLMLFRELRADLNIAAYQNSALLRYLEEALAESYAQLRVNGIRGLPAGIRFPIANGYVTLRAVATEAAAASLGGTITVGGIVYAVQIDPR